MTNSVPRPHPSRCDPALPTYDAILRAHENAVETGAATYRDPATGLSVLTCAAHLSRGNCCESGCRHCPYIGD